MQTEINEAEWQADSSLEKWFPFSAKEIASLKIEVQKVEAALASYKKVPKDVWIGSNSIGDKVQWLANRCVGSDGAISKLNRDASAADEAAKWLAAGKYRTIQRRHDGSYRFSNEALNIWADGDSIASIVNCEHWPKFRDCTEVAP